MEGVIFFHGLDITLNYIHGKGFYEWRGNARDGDDDFGVGVVFIVFGIWIF